MHEIIYHKKRYVAFLFVQQHNLTLFHVYNRKFFPISHVHMKARFAQWLLTPVSDERLRECLLLFLFVQEKTRHNECVVHMK